MMKLIHGARAFVVTVKAKVLAKTFSYSIELKRNRIETWHPIATFSVYDPIMNYCRFLL